MANENTGQGEKPLERALAAVVGVHSIVPGDAMTADVLGTERLGSGVLIREEGVLVTIGYLVTEAERVWVSLADGRVVAGDVAGIDQASGLALVRLLERGKWPSMPVGAAGGLRLGSAVTVASGDATHISARLVARQEFTGYWEYRLEEALFSAPAHAQWGGAAMISSRGELVAIGSLHIPGAMVAGQSTDINMFVPIDLLAGVADEILKFGRTSAPARPWLGVYAQQEGERLVVGSLVRRGPASEGGLRRGDAIISVGADRISDLGSFYRAVWSLGTAGVDVPLTVERQGRVIDMRIKSGDRRDYLKQPTLH